MGKVTGFLEIERQDRIYAPVAERIRHYRDFVQPLGRAEERRQAARCMDCGIPFCHQGCPVNNQIPDWNDLVYRDDWRAAIDNLHSTNNFPEFTGRICPAPCETSCTLNLMDAPVTIKSIECAIVDNAWEKGWIAPQIPVAKTGRHVAIIGSGPAGLACAQQLARAGHDVHVYEKNARAGGLLRYGIPDFKLEKRLIDRRVEQMQAEGVTFHYGVCVGENLSSRELVDSHDAIVLCMGAEEPRDLAVPGRELDSVHFAMDFLAQQNRRVSGENTQTSTPILATGKHVVVIGGGDTGSDCIGTSIRQNALSVTQLEILPRPPLHENKLLTWPDWPLKLRTSSSQEEGAAREFAVMTRGFLGANGKVERLSLVRVDERLQPIKGAQFEIPADLVLLAMGFVHPVREGLVADLGVDLDARGNVLADIRAYETSLPKIFTAGDARRGQSLVVWAIREGRQAAHSVDAFLMGSTDLPR